MRKIGENFKLDVKFINVFSFLEKTSFAFNLLIPLPNTFGHTGFHTLTFDPSV